MLRALGPPAMPLKPKETYVYVNICTSAMPFYSKETYVYYRRMLRPSDNAFALRMLFLLTRRDV